MRSALIASTFLLLASPTVFAANTVKWDTGQPAVAAGQISAKGTYTIDAGWTAIGSSLIVVPTGGGAGFSANGGVDTTAKTWGPLTINSIPTGQYNVTATVTFKMGVGTVVIYSPVSIVNVP